jgi:hypothetical protein
VASQIRRAAEFALVCIEEVQPEGDIAAGFQETQMPIELCRLLILVALAFSDRFRECVRPWCDPRRLEQFVRVSRDRIGMFLRDEHLFGVRSDADLEPYFVDYRNVLEQLTLMYRQRFDFSGRFFAFHEAQGRRRLTDQDPVPRG